MKLEEQRESSSLCTGKEISTSFESVHEKAQFSTTKKKKKKAVIQKQNNSQRKLKNRKDRGKTKRLKIICVKRLTEGEKEREEQTPRTNISLFFFHRDRAMQLQLSLNYTFMPPC